MNTFAGKRCTVDIRVDIRREAGAAEVGLALYADPEEPSEAWRGPQLVRSFGAVVRLCDHRREVERMRRRAEEWAASHGYALSEPPRVVMEGSLLDEIKAEEEAW